MGLYKRGMRTVHTWMTEMRSADLALTPLMLAERDREYLKQLRRNREAEDKLMADVEGWGTGTWYGHKVYKVSHTLVLYLGTVPWYCTLVLYLGTVPWYGTLVLYLDTVPWYCTVVLYLGTVPWYCTLVLWYRLTIDGADHWGPARGSNLRRVLHPHEPDAEKESGEFSGMAQIRLKGRGRVVTSYFTVRGRESINMDNIKK